MRIRILSWNVLSSKENRMILYQLVTKITNTFAGLVIKVASNLTWTAGRVLYHAAVATEHFVTLLTLMNRKLSATLS